MNWENKNVIITGAGGFIGSNLTEKMARLGANVSAFVRYNSAKKAGFISNFEPSLRKKINVVYGDITELETLQKELKGQDVVFHLAASISVPYSFKNPEEVIAVNAKGTLNILTAAKDQGLERVIITSSSEVYGTAKYTPIDEKHDLQAQSPYAASKIAGDKYAESFFKTYNFPVTIVRPFNTYGPRQSARAVIPTIITQALTLDKIKLGAISPRRDFLFVEDTISGFIKVAESANTYGEVFNLGTNKDYSIGETAEKVCELLGKNLEIVTDEQRIRPKNAEVNILCGDATKIKDAIGWAPKFDLEQGLAKTIDWIKGNINLYKPKEYQI